MRKTINEDDNDILRGVHYVEQKAERVAVDVVKKANPVAIYKYAKNISYRKFKKLELKELKNNKKIALTEINKQKLNGTYTKELRDALLLQKKSFSFP
ncbi:MAG: hypothetical protein FWF50_04130 [Defluviitaleaceae bacterium]|nr:hypothetical protein [Defluviitaleaceae bacterium]